MLTEADIVVIGGNPGGCAAAVAAARSGYKVVLLEPTKTLGGINANGVFAFDSATPQALSGIADEVSARIGAYYERIGLEDPLFTRRADRVWESHVAAQIWLELLNETTNLIFLLGAVPVGVEANGLLTEVHWQTASDPMGNVEPDGTRNSLRGRIFIDASYEADVTAWAGAPYRIGREARSWMEPHAGRLFTSNMDNAPDGTMPQSILPGSTGEADDGIMAFACRLHCRLYEDRSASAPHRLQLPPPGYDPRNYSWGPVDTAPDGSPVYFNTLYVLVNNKFLLNRMAKGNNLVGPAREYILADPSQRGPLRQRFVDHALGYLYYIQTEGGLPELGLAHDEFGDNRNIPYQIYVREGRRIEGEATLTEADITPYISGDGCRPRHNPESIAIHDWIYESHGCTDEHPVGYPNPEGFIYNRVSRTPYQVPYGCLLPKKIDNLLVCGSISATHIGWSAVRCESARIQTGIAAGVAAGLALRFECPPREVPTSAIQEELLARGGKLTYFADVESTHPNLQAIQWAALRSFVPKDQHWRFFPDTQANWGLLAEAVVTCLRLPISVTGAHFDSIGPRHSLFRILESLYDLGTRAGIDLFGAKSLADEDPIVAILRADRNQRKIPFQPDAPVRCSEAITFLGRIAAALGHRMATDQQTVPGPYLTRAGMCRLLRDLDRDCGGAASTGGNIVGQVRRQT